ncbi:MAG: hypothetical protein HRU15_08970, partial [Planctomycetes bacterium]|nr:hypothetical protein [Planctomycetota bacterium]
MTYNDVEEAIGCSLYGGNADKYGFMSLFADHGFVYPLYLACVPTEQLRDQQISVWIESRYAIYDLHLGLSYIVVQDVV